MNSKINRWLILAAGFVFNICLSGASTFSIFVRPLMELTGWAQGDITLSYTLYILMLCVFGIVIGALGRGIKVSVLMYAGSALYALGWVLTGFAPNVRVMQLAFGLLTGAGGGCLYNFTITNTSKWFPDKKGLVSGLLLGGAALGPVIFAPAATGVINSLGVRSAYIILGAVFAAAMFSFGWLIRVPSEEQAASGSENGTAERRTVELDWRGMLKTRVFYLLYFIFMFACVPTLMMLGDVADIGQDQAGLSASEASFAVILLALSNFAGRIFFGFISDKIGRFRTLALVLALNICAVLLLSQISGSALFLIIMSVIGACGGAVLVMFPPICSDSFGVRNSGLNYAILFSAYSISAFIGPQLIARTKLAYGSYTAAFIIAAVLMAVAELLLFILTRQRSRAGRKTA